MILCIKGKKQLLHLTLKYEKLQEKYILLGGNHHAIRNS